MSVKAIREAAPEALPAETQNDDFQSLEEKVYRTIEMFKAARDARAAAERDAQRLREQLEQREEEMESLRAQVIALRREREEVRTRVEKMLSQIDALTAQDSGG